MRRTVRGLVPWLALVVAACGGDDGGGVDGGVEDGADDGADDGVDDGAVTCAGEVSGEASGEFAACGAVVVHFPDGTPVLEGRDGWLFTLAATTSVGDVDPPLESIAVSFEVAGEPTAGTFRLSDTVPGVTSGIVTLLDDTFYGTLADATLVLSSLDEALDEVQDGYRVVTFDLAGSLEMTLEREGGASVSVSASF